MSSACLVAVLSHRELLQHVLQYMYLDRPSLARLAGTAPHIQRCYEDLQDFLRQLVYHLDLTLPHVDADVLDLPSRAEVLEISISEGLASQSIVLRQLLPRFSSLRHIHVRLVPDPGWLLAETAADREAALDVMAGSDDDAVILAKLSGRRSGTCLEQADHLHDILDVIVRALDDSSWCGSLSGLSIFSLMGQPDLGDCLDIAPSPATADKRGLVRDFWSNITFMSSKSSRCFVEPRL